MNFLGHLWLAQQTGTSMSGAILGDLVRGADFRQYPEHIALGIRLHRRIDTLTDRHPRIVEAVADYPADGRRYAPLLLDLVVDHCLARQWPRFEPAGLEQFALAAATELEQDADWFDKASGRRPERRSFAALLCSYAHAPGMETAIGRVARRLRSPEPMLDAARHWPQAAQRLEPGLEQLMRDVLAGAQGAIDELRAA